MLWQSGQTLTTGAFLTYFALESGASGAMIAWFLVTPELAGLLGLSARAFALKARGRRRPWRIASIAARALTWMIPAAAWLGREQSDVSLGVIWLMLALSQAAQGVASTLFFAWLSELAPEREWGRFFSRRTGATLVVSLTLPAAAGFLRDAVKAHGDPHWMTIAYTAIFAVGALLLTLSLIPMWSLPESAGAAADGSSRNEETPSRSSRTESADDGANRSNYRWLLAHSWMLATFNGLTQAAFFQLQYRVLKLGLATNFLLVDLMYLVQLATAAWAGRTGDRTTPLRPLFWGSLAAAMALPCWMAAVHSRDWRWLVAAHLCWGAFGAVNVAGPQLLFQLRPREHADVAWGLFRQVAGALAGTAGLLGGFWLDWAARTNWTLNVGGVSFDRFAVILAVSFAGRLIAALVVLGIRRPAPTHEL